MAGTRERASDVEKLLGREHGADAGAASEHAHVLESGEGGRLSLAEDINHFANEFQFGANAVGVATWLGQQGEILAERGKGVRTDELAYLLEFQ